MRRTSVLMKEILAGLDFQILLNLVKALSLIVICGQNRLISDRMY